MILGALEHLPRHHVADHVLDEIRLDLGLLDLGAVLGGDDDGVHAHRLPIAVLDRYLRLAVGAQVGQGAVLAHLGQAPGQVLRQHDGHGHQFRRLGAGIAKHHPLIARADAVQFVIIG